MVSMSRNLDVVLRVIPWDDQRTAPPQGNDLFQVFRETGPDDDFRLVHFVRSGLRRPCMSVRKAT